MANDDLGHVAMPKLYGAPAYARPPRPVVETEDRPFDPDELPLESHQTDEERELAKQLVGAPYPGAATTDQVFASREGSPLLRGRPFRLRSIAGRLRGSDSTNGTGHAGADGKHKKSA